MTDLASLHLVLVFCSFHFSSRHVFDSAQEAVAFAKGFRVANGLMKTGLDLRAYVLPTDEDAMKAIESAVEIQAAYDAVKGTFS